MDYKKKIFGKLLSLILVGCIGAGCGSTAEKMKESSRAEQKESDLPSESVGAEKEEGKSGTEKKLKLTVTTSFLQDMASVLAGDFTDITLVIPAGEDPHTYEAKPEDHEKFKNAELVLYHGLHFEGKMTELLEAVHGVPVTADFKKEDLITMEEGGGEVTDPHFWFDTALYQEAVKKAASSLEEKLPEHRQEIEKNCAAYLDQLDSLKSYCAEQIEKIPEGSRILVTPHDAFNYFSRSYGIEVKAPQGVSTDAELSTSDMAETADFIVSHKIKAIFAESTTDPARMEKLRESCKAKGWEVSVVRGEGKELFSDSLAPKGQDGDNYIDMVKHNVDLIVSNLE